MQRQGLLVQKTPQPSAMAPLPLVRASLRTRRRSPPTRECTERVPYMSWPHALLPFSLTHTHLHATPLPTPPMLPPPTAVVRKDANTRRANPNPELLCMAPLGPPFPNMDLCPVPRTGQTGFSVPCPVTKACVFGTGARGVGIDKVQGCSHSRSLILRLVFADGDGQPWARTHRLFLLLRTHART